MDSYPQFIGRSSNTLKIGIVGLPNVGKSTLFNILSGQSIPASNYSFCTIDPNSARITVPETRLFLFKKVFNPPSLIPPFLNIIDIAGLVKGASEGKGLGNAFLSHINSVDAIFEVIRAFKDEKIEHFEGEVNPVRDLEIIKSELVKKDLQKMESLLKENNRKWEQSKQKEDKLKLSTAQKVIELLKENKTVLSLLKPKILKDNENSKNEKIEKNLENYWNVNQIDLLSEWLLLTSKPIIYLVNVSLKDWIRGGNNFFKKIKEWIQNEDEERFGNNIIPFCAEYEKQLKEKNFTKIEEIKSKFKIDKVKNSKIDEIVKEGYNSLNLIHFFTAGPKEVKCWTIRRGTKAKQAAGCIHTDLEKSFICVEVYSYEDFESFGGSESELKSKGKYRKEGKDYVVKDGDVLYFKSGLGKKK